jgi:MFS family permease
VTSDRIDGKVGITPGAVRPLGRRFRYFWATFVVASLGDGLGYGAVPLLALFVDPHPLAVSGAAAADTFPWLVLALPAGAIADRYERGRVMALTNLGRALVLATLALLVVTRRIDYALFVLLVFTNGGARAIYYSASQATVPELVEPDAFSHANGILSSTEAATEHLGGPILGTLAFTASRALPFVGDALAVGIAGLSLFGLRTQRLRPSRTHNSILDGARQLVKDRSLRLLVTMLAALAGLQGLVMGVLVLTATVDWRVPKNLYGVFLAVGAAGNVPGALVADRIAKRIGNVPTLVASAFVSGVAYLAMAMSRGWPLAGTAFFLVSFVTCTGSVIAISLRLRLSPADLMGRVGSAWRGIIWGTIPIGSLVGGFLAGVGGLRLPLFIAGVAQCVVAILLAGPLTRSIADSERAAAVATRSKAFSGPALEGQEVLGSSNGGQAVAPAVPVDSPPMPAGRRLHSRPGYGPFYWGRSPRNGKH